MSAAVQERHSDISLIRLIPPVLTADRSCMPPSVPDVGDHAVDFTLPSTQGTLCLSEMLRKGAVLLVFYPKDNTLVCTRQLCNYRDNLSVFDEFDVSIAAINDDPIETHRAFAAKYDFPFALASDVDRRVCHAY